jgi:hypothetical protein
MNFLNLLHIIFLFAFTLFFAYDFFPNIPFGNAIPDGALIAMFIGLFLFSLLFKSMRFTSNIDKLKWNIFSTTYLVFLIVLFTILGGKSSIGLSFDNGGLWGILTFLIYNIFSQWKKIKKVEE